jgi:hypothetical protein
VIRGLRNERSRFGRRTRGLIWSDPGSGGLCLPRCLEFWIMRAPRYTRSFFGGSWLVGEVTLPPSGARLVVVEKGLTRATSVVSDDMTTRIDISIRDIRGCSICACNLFFFLRGFPRVTCGESAKSSKPNRGCGRRSWPSGGSQSPNSHKDAVGPHMNWTSPGAFLSFF